LAKQIKANLSHKKKRGAKSGGYLYGKNIIVEEDMPEMLSDEDLKKLLEGENESIR